MLKTAIVAVISLATTGACMYWVHRQVKRLEEDINRVPLNKDLYQVLDLNEGVK